MNIYVCGSLRDIPRNAELCHAFVEALGAEIVKRGHVLFNGCRSSLDEKVARAAVHWLQAHEPAVAPEQRVLAYRTDDADSPAVHQYGTVRLSELTDWNMTHPTLLVPEQIARADVTLFVAGSEGTFLAKNWAHYARKPILGVPRFGGSGEQIYWLELNRRLEAASISCQAYESLNQSTTDMAAYAARVVSSAEEIVRPKRVFIAMPFDKRFDPIYDAFERVCRRLDLNPERTDKSHSQDRINARIEQGIRECGFFVAHIGRANANVFFEVGLARGLGKPVMLAAKRGSEVPFDVTDMQRIIYGTLAELERDLEVWLQSLSVVPARPVVRTENAAVPRKARPKH